MCSLETEALFSGGSSGEFVASLLAEGLLPPTESYSLLVDRSDADGRSLSWEIHLLFHDLKIQAIRLGLLARELRGGKGSPDSHGGIQQVFCLLFPRLCAVQQRQGSSSTPARPLLDHCRALFHACVIYSHTRLRLPLLAERELEDSVSEVLEIGEKIVREEKYHLRYVVFPLFVAGTASADDRRKTQALELISRMEKTGIGINTVKTRKTLEIVYERQKKCPPTEDFRNIDWNEIMVDKDLQVANFGL